MTNGTIELEWADGKKYHFNVALIEHALELEEKCAAGLFEIFIRLRDGKWRVNDIFETIRIGLLGGGDCTPAQANKLMTRYVKGRPWGESVPVARAILLAAIVGVPEDNDVGKKPADQTKTEPGHHHGLSDPHSTESALQ